MRVDSLNNNLGTPPLDTDPATSSYLGTRFNLSNSDHISTLVVSPPCAAPGRGPAQPPTSAQAGTRRQGHRQPVLARSSGPTVDSLARQRRRKATDKDDRRRHQSRRTSSHLADDLLDGGCPTDGPAAAAGFGPGRVLRQLSRNGKTWREAMWGAGR